MFNKNFELLDIIYIMLDIIFIMFDIFDKKYLLKYSLCLIKFLSYQIKFPNYQIKKSKFLIKFKKKFDRIFIMLGNTINYDVLLSRVNLVPILKYLLSTVHLSLRDIKSTPIKPLTTYQLVVQFQTPQNRNSFDVA